MWGFLYSLDTSLISALPSRRLPEVRLTKLTDAQKRAIWDDPAIISRLKERKK
jgi:hypothetical protein